MTKYKGYYIQREDGCIQGTKLFSILTDADLERIANREWFLPVREFSLRDAKRTIDNMINEKPAYNHPTSPAIGCPGSL